MSITEKDIMVGDWVQYGENPTVKTRVLAISSVDKGKHWYIEVEPENANSMRIVAMHAVEPIPLTAEILEKNGFEAFDYFLKIQINSTLIELRPIQGNMAIWLDWDEDNDGVYADFILPYPKYLHELQHALRLAGIEKNIIV